MIEQITANDFVDVKDIKGMFLYTKSNKIFSYLRIYPFNLDLLTTEDRRNLTNRLAAAFDGDRKNFMYCTLPRELDLDGYKIFLKEKQTTGNVSAALMGLSEQFEHEKFKESFIRSSWSLMHLQIMYIRQRIRVGTCVPMAVLHLP